MKFIHQGLSQQSTRKFEGESNDNTSMQRKDSDKQDQNTIFSSQGKSQINNQKVSIRGPLCPQKDLNVQELVQMISKLQKTQINTICRLFIQLGFSLSLAPQNIQKIKPLKGFIYNLIEFLRQLVQNGQNQEGNLSKVYRHFINSLLYTLMLLLTRDKQCSYNQQFKNKLLTNKAFLKNLLMIRIYKDTKISKLYGIVILSIYKANLASDIRNRLVHNIIKNLKFLDHQKTQLNLSMILNQLKSSYKIRQTLLKQENLVQIIQGIFEKNKHNYQSLHTLNYLLHLWFEFPDASRGQFSAVKRKVEITQMTKQFTLTSSLYERTFTRYLQFVHQFGSQESNLSMVEDYLSKISTTLNSLKCNESELFLSQKWIHFLLKNLQTSLRLIQNQQGLLNLLESNLICHLDEILRKGNFENYLHDKVYDILAQLLQKAQIYHNSIGQSLSRYIIQVIIKNQTHLLESNSRRYKIIKKATETNQKHWGANIQLQ